jgi:formate dehydrogenase iron-sulfur subunit
MTLLDKPDSDPTLIDKLLEEQQRLTAVERFARKHEQCDLPAQSRYYRDLIPFEKPREGQQYAFAVDLDACTGCKACVSACHSLNGLDEDETWRHVGFIHGGTVAEPLQQTVTTACHHCVDPACLNGCPVDAYDKDEVTGIVRHLDDQCIGCQYCVLKCPYDVPQYSKKRGIVRKCDMCSNRLAVGEAPACVQACPHEAIRIELVDKEEVSLAAKQDTRLIAGAFDSDYTKPTTHYRTRKNFPANMRPANSHAIKSEHSHMPLVVMLVLTQLSVGAFCVQLSRPSATATLIALAAGLTGIVASTTHLGRPLYAWRAVIGLRHSWLSREIVGFGVFAKLALIYSASFWVPVAKLTSTLPFVTASFFLRTQTLLGFGVAFSGIACVFCSAMIYHDTHREFWRGFRTFGKFFGTALLLGPAAALIAQPSGRLLALLLIVVSVVKLAWERGVFRHLDGFADDEDLERVDVWPPMMRTAMLMASRPLARKMRARFICGALGGVLLPLGFLFGEGNAVLAVVVLALCFIGEILERHLFFTAVVAPKMPGGIHA